ncbi:Gfo/Idh/MocA family protein [Fictibacillus gelatini]|uniref:Gfo/Idh/MocA family protein n=1 Tax=Fictibacillus gelatini TaxID=225985 RepID=UPI0004195035|nr:Gfo/Idh/MocA family oxidoreductase [Fictibacillus gelatini]
MQHVLVIGAGTMGTVHASSYAKMENVELAGIVDIRKQIGGPLAAKLNTNYFTSFEEAVTQLPRIDVIDVCLPTYLHKKYVLKAADLGKHVICEKPLARTKEDAKEMISYCKEKGVKLFVGHVLRFFPEYVKAKEIIDKNEIGKPAMARTTRGGIFPTAWNDWYADYKNSGGLVLDMIIHDIDFLRWCFGDVKRVYAKSVLGRSFNRIDYALLTLRFENGMIAHVEGTWAHEGFSTYLEIAGDNGIIEFDSKKEKSIYAQIRQKENGGGVAVPSSPLKENPYYQELAHFMECIENDCEPIVSAEDAFKAVEISLAALESIETGKVVEIKPSLTHA